MSSRKRRPQDSGKGGYSIHEGRKPRQKPLEADPCRDVRRATPRQLHTFPEICDYQDPEDTLIEPVPPDPKFKQGNFFFNSDDPASADALKKLCIYLGPATMDATRNKIGLNFDNFRRNLNAIGHIRLSDKRTTLLRTKNHYFMLTDFNPEIVQNDYNQLMSADFSKRSTIVTNGGKELFLTLVGFDDLMMLRAAQNKTSDISGISKREISKRKDSLLSMDDGDFDQALFEKRLRDCEMLKGSIVFINPADIADKLILALMMVDIDGIGRCSLVLNEHGEEENYTLEIHPERPQMPDLSQPCFTYGEEFCVLYGPE
jgi:hypothetical protein